MNLSIIIPLYNESESIVLVLKHLKDISYPDYIKSVEIIIIDDCSTDNSFNKVAEYIGNKSNISLYQHSKNKGKGAAVRTGISKASGNLFLIQDADSELSPADIPSMLEAMHKLNVEFINGSRFLPGICRPLYSYQRYLGNKFLTFLTSILINVRLTDMACGYKLFTKTLYDKLTLRENRFGFEAELIIKALRIKKNNISEIPIQYFPRNKGEGKKLRTLDGIKILFTIIKYGLFKLN